LYFGLLPASFPYDFEAYTRDALISIIVFLFIIPWLLAFSYYIYEIPLAKKAVVTLLMLAYFCVFAPTQLLVHAICLHLFSALMLPLLYVVFGAILYVMLFIAFYSWAMSESESESDCP
jgi:predicted membrane protein